MKKNEFLEKLKEAIQTEDAINENTVLCDIEEWDSLAAVSSLALFKKALGLNINAAQIKNCKTIGDILILGADKYE